MPSVRCDRCRQPAEHYSTAERTAIDLDLDQPVLLSVTVSVHRCPACQHYFRAQPPFLRMDATYSQRVVRKAIEAVHQDGMAMRRVPERLARDFWVAPSEGMVRLWSKAYQAAFDFTVDYQQWVVREFSGILCVDEVYQDQLALLLAVDPAAPDGDRLVGYQLVHGHVDSATVEAFLTHLRVAGINPDQVISDGAALYPAVLGKVWPGAAHQLCLFHETRRVTKAAMDVIQAARSTLPSPPPPVGHCAWRGRLPDQPPTDNPEDPAHQRWLLRKAARQTGIAQVHALAQQGLSQRAIARQLGIHRDTVKRWLHREAPAEVPAGGLDTWRHRKLPDVPFLRRAARQAKRAQVHQLARKGLSYSAIGREVGLHRVTVKSWLQVAPPPNRPMGSDGADDAMVDAALSDDGALDPDEPRPATPVTGHHPQDEPGHKHAVVDPPPPPAPWLNWEQVKEVREALREHRFLLLRRPAHLDADEEAQVTRLLESPLSQIGVAHSFLLDWYALWQDDQGRRRAPEEAWSRYETWRSNPTYRAEPALRRVLDQMTDAHFQQLSPFLRNHKWEATNNGAERAGRAFRHGQAPHFNLRRQESIEGAIIAAACQRRASAQSVPAQQASRATRGRKPRAPA